MSEESSTAVAEAEVEETQDSETSEAKESSKETITEKEFGSKQETFPHYGAHKGDDRKAEDYPSYEKAPKYEEHIKDSEGWVVDESSVLEDAMKTEVSGDEMDLGSRVKSIGEAAGLTVKNAVDMTAGKLYVKSKSRKTEAGLKKGDKVLVVVHGHWQNEGAFQEFLSQAESDGFKVIVLGYDYNAPLADSAKILDEKVRDVYNATGTLPSVIGHSQGGMIAMEASSRYGTDKYVDRIVLSQSPIYGESFKPIHEITGLPSWADPATPEGRATVESMHISRPSCPVYSIVGNYNGKDDGMVGISEGSYRHGYDTTIVDGATHMHGAGGHKGYNSIVLSKLRSEDSDQTTWTLENKVARVREFNEDLNMKKCA